MQCFHSHSAPFHLAFFMVVQAAREVHKRLPTPRPLFVYALWTQKGVWPKKRSPLASIHQVKNILSCMLLKTRFLINNCLNPSFFGFLGPFECHARRTRAPQLQFCARATETELLARPGGRAFVLGSFLGALSFLK